MRKLISLALAALLLGGCATARLKHTTFPDGRVEVEGDMKAFMSEQTLDAKGYRRGRTIDTDALKKGAKLGLDLLQ